MIVREQVPLARLSTLRVGGPARFVCEVTSEEEVRTALGIAQAQGLPWRVLGEGSNVLASDAGFDGVLMHMKSTGIERGVRSSVSRPESHGTDSCGTQQRRASGA